MSTALSAVGLLIRGSQVQILPGARFRCRETSCAFSHVARPASRTLVADRAFKSSAHRVTPGRPRGPRCWTFAGANGQPFEPHGVRRRTPSRGAQPNDPRGTRLGGTGRSHVARSFRSRRASAQRGSRSEEKRSRKAMAEPRPLLERLGGVFAIAGVVDHFSDAVVKNSIVGQKSKNPALPGMAHERSRTAAGPQVHAHACGCATLRVGPSSTQRRDQGRTPWAWKRPIASPHSLQRVRRSRGRTADARSTSSRCPSGRRTKYWVRSQPTSPKARTAMSPLRRLADSQRETLAGPRVSANGVVVDGPGTVAAGTTAAAAPGHSLL